MRALFSILTLTVALASAGCGSIFGPADRGRPPLTELPRALSLSERSLIDASNHFAFDLLREARARAQGPNVVLSPLSATMALGMTMSGARGETFTGMRAALGFGDMAPTEIDASYRSLTDLLLGLDDDVDMRLANSIWVRQGFPLHAAFVQGARHFFGAETTALDFDDPGVPAIINGWVNRSTGGRIRDIVGPIDPTVALYLINAVYFKGSWTREFDRARTREAPFHRPGAPPQQVRMMHLPEGPVRHLVTPDAEIVDLPYGRQAFSMTLVLPAAGRSLDQLVASLDAQRWGSWMGQLRESRLEVFLPRFRLEHEQVLNETLKALGMEVAFDERADFGGISPREGLFIGNVKQKTFLDVNEEGTEAAAATAVEMRVVSLPPSFRVDRPFLVAIRERLSGTILFIGTIGAPGA